MIGSKPAPGTDDVRRYQRHWTPVHIAFHVEDFDAFLEKAVSAGAKCEQKFEGGGRPATAFCSDPFGITTTLHDTYKVDYIAPGHYTGEPTFAALQKAFGDHCLYAGLGTTLDLGVNPRTTSDRRATGVLDDADSSNYRALLAQSDDLSEGMSQIRRLAQAR